MVEVERRQAARIRAARRLTLESALAEVAGALGRRGVQPLVLKGPVFARWLYDDPGQRSYADIDLLVDPDQFHTASSVLTGLGFEPYLRDARPHERADHHEVWDRFGRVPVRVELHHTLLWVSAPPSVVWERMSAGARPIEVAGVRVVAPSEVSCTLIVGLHAAQHGVAAAKPLRDLERAVQRVRRPTWQAAAALARELGADQAFAAGMRLDPGGCELADQLGLATTSPRLVRLLASSSLPDTAIGLERLFVTRGVRARWRLIVQEFAASPEFMRACYPVARKGRMGLIAAYLYRPVHTAVKLPRGLRAWLRVALAPAGGRPRG